MTYIQNDVFALILHKLHYIIRIFEGFGSVKNQDERLLELYCSCRIDQTSPHLTEEIKASLSSGQYKRQSIQTYYVCMTNSEKLRQPTSELANGKRVP